MKSEIQVKSRVSDVKNHSACTSSNPVRVLFMRQAKRSAVIAVQGAVGVQLGSYSVRLSEEVTVTLKTKMLRRVFNHHLKESRTDYIFKMVD